MTDYTEVKWKYKVADVDLSQLQERLNTYGDDKWEAFAIDFDWSPGTAKVVFKQASWY